jgi:hypothetical protein
LPEIKQEETSLSKSFTKDEEQDDVDLDEQQELEKLKDQFNLRKSSACC